LLLASYAQDIAPGDEVLPEGHAKHEVEPPVGWYVPTEQFEHTAAPIAEYLPAPQPVQLLAPLEAWLVLAGHWVQEVEPDKAAYVPGAHTTHTFQVEAPIVAE